MFSTASKRARSSLWFQGPDRLCVRFTGLRFPTDASGLRLDRAPPRRPRDLLREWVESEGENVGRGDDVGEDVGEGEDMRVRLTGR